MIEVNTSGDMLLAIRGGLVVVIFAAEAASGSLSTIKSFSSLIGGRKSSASGSAVVEVEVEVEVVVDDDVDVDVVLLAGLLFRRDTNLSGRLTSGCLSKPPLKGVSDWAALSGTSGERVAFT